MPLVVCVTPDREVRESLVRRLDDLGAVLVCSDLGELRAMLTQVDAADQETPPVVEFGGLVVDNVQHTVAWHGQPLELTRLEHRLLTRLASPPLTVWPYERLFAAVWDSAYLGDTSILHSAVKRLRSKLRALDGGPVVETVRGIGYRLAPAS
ncbi:winged helix-turn-helix domain-containing protein [Symbioplanes lichenis]|uniref:winged helix-turn-helix domain-containing protein n=1 Tax=Symbioplanes lichenis TaxID=1629072 RepID=UPI002738CF35|nr:winged helix-turn-helix domain-containing protein [Actinoplanes lichenis]